MSAGDRQRRGDRLARRRWRRRWRVQHLRQGDAAQRVGDDVVDPAPVGAHAARLLDAAGAGVDAAFGHAERAFHCLDDLDQADLAGGAGEAVAAVGTAEALDQPGLRQWFQQLGDRRHLQAGPFGEFGRTQHRVRPRGERGQDDGGVIGELGDAKHEWRGPESVPKLYGFRASGPSWRSGFNRRQAPAAADRVATRVPRRAGRASLRGAGKPAPAVRRGRAT